MVLVSASESVDTIPPQGKLTNPPSLTLINSSQVRVSAQANDHGSGVKQVCFFASYYPHLDTSSRAYTSTGRGKVEQIACITKSPFEYVWDCSGIPDQDNWRMFLYCDITDSAGNISHRAGGVHKWIVIDRNPDLSVKTFKSGFTGEPVTVDGALDDWKPGDTLQMVNDNNRLALLSLWNDEFAYFGIQVMDQHLYSRRATDEDSAMPYWHYDMVTLFFDVAHDHSSFRMRDDLQINLTPGTIATGNVVEFKSGLDKSLEGQFNHAVRLRGTLNDSTDLDTGYTIELAIPWKTLGTQPAKGLTMGFDLFNVDNDYGSNYRISRGWSGTTRNNNNNPSEWGNILFTGGAQIGFSLPWIILAGLAVVGVGLIIRSRKSLSHSTQPTPTRNQVTMQKIKQYVASNHENRELSIDQIAGAIGLSADHVRKIIKSESGLTTPQYINQARIERAKELLRQDDLSISEVAFAVGYASLEYFINNFKKHTGLKPGEFRLKNSKIS